MEKQILVAQKPSYKMRCAMVYRLSRAVAIAVLLLPATNLALSQSAPPSAATKQLPSDVRTLLEQKKRQLNEVVLVLQKLRNAIPPVPGRDPITANAQRIFLEKNKTDLLIATDETAAELKAAESKVAKQRPRKNPANEADEEQEAATMASKIKRLRMLSEVQGKLLMPMPLVPAHSSVT